ncbi:hypothetical protein ANCDUO_22978 [Ancylostoma duodenale]|uniref:Uncharacterized protein n=1 Tax=Ancylostoma duodenale TaxID=51022 RepID=A0A0C2CAU9_9BILA|nr:hypothetical protein ANCDUO_22978 [Ancylostoma duodenale]
MSIRVSALSGPSGREFQEKPLKLADFAELFRLFNTRMRKDLRDVFNDVFSTTSTSAHCPKREKERHTARVPSRLANASCPNNPDFLSSGQLHCQACLVSAKVNV